MRKELLAGHVDFEVLVNGRPISEYPHESMVWVEGRKNSKYSLRLMNKTISRFLAVISVDGLSIMDGKSASLKESGGYVVPAWGEIEIPGWRLDQEKVAAFTFADLAKSYASSISEEASNNVGVIACALFQEQFSYNTLEGVTPRWYYSSSPYYCGNTVSINAVHPSSCPNQAVCSASTDGLYVEQLTGTAFGKPEEHLVLSVNFNKKDEPSTVFEIYYDSRRGLEKRGVSMPITPPRSRKPSPFPASSKEFCSPPKDWTGK